MKLCELTLILKWLKAPTLIPYHRTHMSGLEPVKARIRWRSLRSFSFLQNLLFWNGLRTLVLNVLEPNSEAETRSVEEKGPWVKDETEEIRKAVSNIDDVFLGL